MSPDALAPGPDETLDVLSRRLRLLQRKRGHRATSDDVVLAGVGLAARPAPRRVLDLGSGKGTVALLIADVSPGATVVGVEAFEASHRLAVRNAALNGLADRYLPLLGDLRDAKVLDGEAPFDLVCGAPPFMPPGTGVLPQDPQRAAGRFELRGGVADYARTAARHLAPGGALVLLMDGHGRERLLAAFSGAGLSCSELLAVRPRPSRPPSFWVGTAIRADVPDRRDAALDMRPAEGERWTPAYAALRARLNLP